MKVHDILNTLGNILHNNAAIEAFTQANYSKSFKVFVGVNPEDPPQPEDYPIIVIKGIERANRGEAISTIIFECEISVTINQPATTVSQDGKLVVFNGLVEVEEFREIVEDVIEQTPSSVLPLIISASGETYRESLYPIFHSDSLLTLETPRSFRK